MSDTSDMQILLKQFEKLEQQIIEDRKETNRHLEKLRDNLHGLVNEMHGVSSLSKMQQERITKLEDKSERLGKALHEKIDGSIKEIKREMADLNEQINSIKPTANTVDKIGNAVIKWAVPVFLGAILVALGINRLS